ncbi:hypothetical protein NDA16_002729 [Ustilago loliicola]|nr:hypothetical protein NDA16_002729 [Ustilago loliicola]
MKYLLQAIEAKRSSVKLADAELRDLLTEVCKGRDEREEFLESIDRIITELKNYTEHSTAFLSKVSKRDAPDYYDVIKHPMDLGTMQKKVKSGQYKTKKQFAADLELIWENCLTYNSDPSHPLRRNVAFMRKKANHLLEFIGEKSEVRDVLGQWGTTNRPQGAEINGTKGEDVAGQGVNGKQEPEIEERKRKKRKEEGGKFEDQEAFIRIPASMMDFARIDVGLSVVEQSMAAGAGPSSRPMMTAMAMQPLEAMDKIKADAEEEEDPLSTVLSSIFAPPLQRGKAKEKATPEPQSQSQTQSDAGSVTTTSNTAAGLDISPLDASADWFTVTTSQRLMTGALPSLPSSIRIPVTSADPSADLEGQGERGRKRRKKPYHLIPATRRKGLQGKIARNIRTLHKVQATHAKFLSLAHFVENEAPIPAYLTSMSSDEESDYPSDPEDDTCPTSSFESTRNPFTKVSAESAREHASYNVRLILAHQGFEGGHRGAVDVLTDTLGEFLGNMGRMLRLYSDRYANAMSAEEMILHTLQETQGADVLSLENYIRNDVERYGSKMSDLLRKLRSSYREQFSLSTERGRGVIEDEALFADNGEALVAGNFAEDLGDDYFGFKELGLDREVGLSGLTVPSRLFYGRGKNSALLARAGGDVAAKENVLPYPPPPEPIPLVAAAITDQIGLLQPFYNEKMREHRHRTKHAQELASAKATEETQEDAEEREKENEQGQKKDWVLESNTLPDQEQEKQRYKVPPTGKMPRRIIWSTATERKWLIDREREKLDREKVETSAMGGMGAVAMSTGAGGTAGNKAKVKKNGITA